MGHENRQKAIDTDVAAFRSGQCNANSTLMASSTGVATAGMGAVALQPDSQPSVSCAPRVEAPEYLPCGPDGANVSQDGVSLDLCLWRASFKDVFAVGASLRAELCNEAAGAIQRWWRNMGSTSPLTMGRAQAGDQPARTAPGCFVSFLPGTRVEAHSLMRQDLNGQQGRVQGTQGDRVQVIFDDARFGGKALKASNLRPLQTPDTSNDEPSSVVAAPAVPPMPAGSVIPPARDRTEPTNAADPPAFSDRGGGANRQEEEGTPRSGSWLRGGSGPHSCYLDDPQAVRARVPGHTPHSVVTGGRRELGCRPARRGRRRSQTRTSGGCCDRFLEGLAVGLSCSGCCWE